MKKMGWGAKKLEQCFSKTDEYLIRWGLIFKREKKYPLQFYMPPPISIP